MPRETVEFTSFSTFDEFVIQAQSTRLFAVLDGRGRPRSDALATSDPAAHNVVEKEWLCPMSSDHEWEDGSPSHSGLPPYAFKEMPAYFHYLEENGELNHAIDRFAKGLPFSAEQPKNPTPYCRRTGSS